MKSLMKTTSITLVFVIFLFLFITNSYTIYASTNEVTQDQAVAWAKEQASKPKDYDGVYGVQCVDLAVAYYQYLGARSPGGNGRDYATNTLPSGWKRIENYNGFIPAPGDIAVWTKTGSEYGHVAIVLSATSSNLTVSEFLGSNHTARTHTYSYSYGTFFGVIRPDFPDTPLPVDLGDSFYACINNPESECHLTNSDNNVNLKSATNDANQLWYFERDSDLGYKITSFVDGTCLDAENGEYSNGTNVQTYDSNSSNSQRWYFIDIGMDHYSIHTKLGNAYIDAHTSGGIIEPGANTQLYSRQDTDAQVYCVNKVNDINAFLAHDIGTGFYANIINPTTGFLLTNTENNVTLNSKVSSGLTTAQIWKFERQPDNSYIIRSFMNNQCLDAENGKAEDGTNLQIYEDNATLAQKWIFVEPGNSNYMIKSVAGNAVIDAKTSAGEISDGANIQLYHPNGTTAQAYSIQPINNINKYFADDVGTDFNAYIINQSTGYRLTNNSNNITLDSETDNNNQVWRFERQEDNSYIIRSVVDSSCIDAEMGEAEDGTNVQTYEYNGTDAQRWYFYKKGNNQYTIVSSKADVVIDAKTSAGEISDGTNIQLYHPNGTDAQIYTIQIIDDEQKILGDADCDDEVTILDVTVIQRYLVGIPVNNLDVTAADCDGDEDISIIDATWIQRYLVQMQVPYNIGEPINAKGII